MRLRRLAVRNFRKLEGPVLIDALGDGLTLVSGCNEEGKSTLLAALKAALFEHHKVGGAVREGMIPLGVAGVVPEVEVELEVAGGRWALRKAFGRGGADLVCPAGRRYSGDAAEDRLRELLAFERREGATKRRPEHHGLAALFWIDQGTTVGGFDTYAAVAKDRLSTAVAGELGALTGGEKATRLLVRVRERCDLFWTPTHFKERGPLKEAGERSAALAAEVQELRRRVEDLAQKEERLERLREERRRAVALDAMGQAAARRDEARRRLEAIDALHQRAALARERLKAGQARRAQCEAAVVDRRRARAALEEDEARLATTRATLAERREALAAAAAALERAEAAEAQARATCRLRGRAAAPGSAEACQGPARRAGPAGSRRGPDRGRRGGDPGGRTRACGQSRHPGPRARGAQGAAGPRPGGGGARGRRHVAHAGTRLGRCRGTVSRRADLAGHRARAHRAHRDRAARLGLPDRGPGRCRHRWPPQHRSGNRGGAGTHVARLRRRGECRRGGAAAARA
jgi:hypothetical protein